jgi:hypothetical protein
MGLQVQAGLTAIGELQAGIAQKQSQPAALDPSLSCRA